MRSLISQICWFVAVPRSSPGRTPNSPRRSSTLYRSLYDLPRH